MWAVTERLILPEALRAQLLKHVQESPSLETCGLLGGQAGRSSSLYRIKNVDPAPAIAFAMDPREMFAALREMEAQQEVLVGIYHSHPTSPAAPSARDMAEAAYPGVAYLIASLQTADTPVLAGFLFNGVSFAPLTLAAD